MATVKVRRVTVTYNDTTAKRSAAQFPVVAVIGTPMAEITCKAIVLQTTEEILPQLQKSFVGLRPTVIAVLAQEKFVEGDKDGRQLLSDHIDAFYTILPKFGQLLGF